MKRNNAVGGKKQNKTKQAKKWNRYLSKIQESQTVQEKVLDTNEVLREMELQPHQDDHYAHLE